MHAMNYVHLTYNSQKCKQNTNCLIGIPVTSKMMPVTGRKHPDIYIVSGYELACHMGSLEFMSLSSLSKYVNRDARKYRSWMEKIHKGLIIPQMSAEKQKESSSRGQYTYFFNFCKGKYVMSIMPRHLQDNTLHIFTERKCQGCLKLSFLM